MENMLLIRKIQAVLGIFHMLFLYFGFKETAECTKIIKL